MGAKKFIKQFLSAGTFNASTFEILGESEKLKHGSGLTAAKNL
jgi:hypothetical protein